MVKRIEGGLLAKVRPLMLADDDAGWQQRKSSDTRVRILEAMIDSLVESGYAAASSSNVIERAGVSRGAMHHHFPTRIALLAATIEYALYSHLRVFLAEMARASAEAESPGEVTLGSEVYWRSIHQREHVAYLELSVAARSDTELQRHFLATAQRFDSIWIGEMRDAFPAWSDHFDRLQLANDFAVAAYLGLYLHHPVLGTAKRIEAVRSLIGTVVGSLNSKA